MVCTECKIEKDDNQFYKDPTRTECKKCSRRKYYHYNKEKTNKKRRDKYQDNKEEILQKGRVYSEKSKKSISENKKNYYQKNKEKILEQRKVHYVEVKEKLSTDEVFADNFKKLRKKASIKYQTNNKERISQSIKDKKKNDPLYKLTDSIRTLIYISLKRMEVGKDKRTEEILGCSIEEFKLYMQEQFTEGMSWENHGEWHLDHKIPVSWGKTKEEIVELNHYTNFQPLWAFENLSKGNKWSD